MMETETEENDIFSVIDSVCLCVLQFFLQKCLIDAVLNQPTKIHQMWPCLIIIGVKTSNVTSSFYNLDEFTFIPYFVV